MRDTLAWAAASALAGVGLVLVRRHTIRARWRLLRGGQTERPAWRPAVRWSSPLAARWPAVAVTAGTFAAGCAAGGPAAAAALAAYAATGAVLLRRVAVRRTVDRARRDAVDAVAAIAGDLRAGLPVGRAIAEAQPLLDRAAGAGFDAAVVAERVGVAVRVADASGAPLADVLERLDSHLRAVDRARAVASAHAAGARASAALLAAMPVAGLGLGAVIGVNPLHVLLRTQVGAAALLCAVALQLAGLRWSAYLSRLDVAA